MILFLVIRYVLGDVPKAQWGYKIKPLKEGFDKHQTSYLLFVRLVPIFPFFLVNLAASLLGVRLKTFLWTSLVGIAPATFIYAAIGNGLSLLLSQNQMPDLNIITKPKIILTPFGSRMFGFVSCHMAASQKAIS